MAAGRVHDVIRWVEKDGWAGVWSVASLLGRRIVVVVTIRSRRLRCTGSGLMRREEVGEEEGEDALVEKW